MLQRAHSPQRHDLSDKSCRGVSERTTIEWCKYLTFRRLPAATRPELVDRSCCRELQFVLIVGNIYRQNSDTSHNIDSRVCNQNSLPSKPSFWMHQSPLATGSDFLLLSSILLGPPPQSDDYDKLLRFNNGRASPSTVGLIFWLTRKRLVGSYLFLTSTNRS